MTSYDRLPFNSFLIALFENSKPSEQSLVSNNRWEWARCIAQVEKEDMKEKIKDSNFIALSLDEVTTIDNTS